MVLGHKGDGGPPKLAEDAGFGGLTVTNFKDFNGPVQTTNLGGWSLNFVGAAADDKPDERASRRLPAPSTESAYRSRQFQQTCEQAHRIASYLVCEFES